MPPISNVQKPASDFIVCSMRTMYNRFMLTTAIIVMTLLLSCTQEASSYSVEKIATQFYDTIQKKEFDKTITYYSDEFFAYNPASSWLEHLKMVNEKLGDLKNVKLKRKNVSTVFSGRRFVYVFSSQYEKGLATETVIFFQHTSKPGIKIQSHKIESKLLPGSRTKR